MRPLYTPRDDCRLCGGREFDRVIDLGELALTGRFPTPEAPAVPRAPLLVQKCRACHLVQLAHDFDGDALFRQTYGYRSGINQTMTQHLHGIVDAVLGRVDVQQGDLVLDIGSNDATLLKGYPTGPMLLGMDPTIAQYGDYYPAGALKVPDFFSFGALQAAVGQRQARVISSIAMLYDIADLHGFVRDIARCLRPDGLWVFEQSYLPLMLETRAFDTICHEHLLYFSLDALQRLLEANGLRIFHAELNDSNGGSSRVFACHADAGFDETENLRSLLAAESQMSLDSLAPFDAFRQDVETLREEVRSFLLDAKAAGKTIYGYGASTKGNTLLQYCEIGAEIIDGIADRNPRKDGLLTPGTRIPIVMEAEARADEPDIFFVLPWHFKPEFIQRERAFIEAGGHLVFPLPRFDAVGSEGSSAAAIASADSSPSTLPSSSPS